MRTLFRALRRTLIALLSLSLIFIVGLLVFISCAPQFGQQPRGTALDKIKSSVNYEDDEFINLEKTVQQTGDESFMKMMRLWMTAEGTEPIDSLPVNRSGDSSHIDSAAYVTWYGHSAILLEIEGKKVLLDPMLGSYASPLPVMGKRFKNKEKAFDLDSIKHIDIIIISHDHYDHLDYESILKLKDKTDLFIMPLGVSSHFKSWEVDSNKIKELDWYQSYTYKGLKITAAPARHFSGRGLWDRNATLWASWAVKGKYKNIYFSGDGGYGKHFKEIGEKLGPFDIAMMECGQYNENWAQIHCMPEQSVQASIDVKGLQMMPIHWGAFDLSVHTWQEPIERAIHAADSLHVDLITPTIGFRFQIGTNAPHHTWWEGIR